MVINNKDSGREIHLKVNEILELHLAEIENSNHQSSGMLQYYNVFFIGMYEFSKKSMYRLFNIYKISERQLAFVVDEIEIFINNRLRV